MVLVVVSSSVVRSTSRGLISKTKQDSPIAVVRYSWIADSVAGFRYSLTPPWEDFLGFKYKICVSIKRPLVRLGVGPQLL